MVLVALLGFILGQATYYIGQALDKMCPWQANVGLRLALSFITIYILYLSAHLLCYHHLWRQFLVAGDLQEDLGKVQLIKLGIITLLVVFTYVLIRYILSTYRSYVRRQITNARLLREQMDVQQSILKSQLHPHFFFNSLNSISSLMHLSTKQAELFIRQLASCYQYALVNFDKTNVTVAEELALVQNYMSMMQVRFGSNIKFVHDIPQQLQDRSILPLSLQSLVENALKHNIVDDHHILQISISGRDDRITVRNNKTLSPIQVSSLHVGIDNLRRRLELWSNQTMQVVDHEKYFAVIVPTA